MAARTCRPPFDPTVLPREPESATQTRHGAVEWGLAHDEPIDTDPVYVDPGLTSLPAVHHPANRFDGSYDDRSVHLTRIEDGVLFGQGFLICSASHPTVSRERLYLVSRERLGELLPNLERREVERGPLYLVCANGGWRNFYHWIFQCVTSIALLRQIAFSRGQSYRLVLPPLEPPHRRTLELLGVRPEECMTLGPREYLYDVPLLYTDVLHDRFIFQPSPRVLALLEPLRDRALGVAPASPSSRVYISRSDSAARRLRNESELAALAREFGFAETVLSRLSVEEQIALWAGASAVLGCHGAGLVGLAFARPGCEVLEIVPDNHRFAFFSRICQARKLRYSAVASASSAHRPAQAKGEQLEVDVNAVRLRLAGP